MCNTNQGVGKKTKIVVCSSSTLNALFELLWLILAVPMAWHGVLRHWHGLSGHCHGVTMAFKTAHRSVITTPHGDIMGV